MSDPAASSDVSDALDASRRAARDAWARRYPNAVSDRVVDGSLRLLGDAVEADPGAPIDPVLREPASLLGVRRALLDLWRQAYAQRIEVPRDPDGEDDPRRHLDRFLRFEEVRGELDPAWDEQVESALAGPKAHEMLAEIGHDLRSPLTSILFLSEVLKGADGIQDDSGQVRQLGLIYSGALTMLNIVNNFMELVRSGEEPSDPEPTVFSLADLMESTRRTVQPMADERGLALEVSNRPLGSERRTGHPVALSRILLNLVTNALKFTDEGDVMVRADEIVPGTVEFSVRDTGPGISEDHLDALFNVFEPAQDKSGVRFSGSGLGLVIVRRLLQSLGSKLECDSEPGVGSRFWFRIELPEA